MILFVWWLFISVLAQTGLAVFRRFYPGYPAFKVGVAAHAGGMVAGNEHWISQGSGTECIHFLWRLILPRFGAKLTYSQTKNEVWRKGIRSSLWWLHMDLGFLLDWLFTWTLWVWAIVIIYRVAKNPKFWTLRVNNFATNHYIAMKLHTSKNYDVCNISGNVQVPMSYTFSAVG